jgi:hypothetical protein
MKSSPLAAFTYQRDEMEDHFRSNSTSPFLPRKEVPARRQTSDDGFNVTDSRVRQLNASLPLAQENQAFNQHNTSH